MENSDTILIIMAFFKALLFLSNRKAEIITASKTNKISISNKIAEVFSVKRG